MDDLSSDICILEKNGKRYTNHNMCIGISDESCFDCIITYFEVILNNSVNGIAQLGKLRFFGKIHFSVNEQMKTILLKDSQEDLKRFIEYLKKLKDTYIKTGVVENHLIRLLMSPKKRFSELDQLHKGNGGSGYDAFINSIEGEIQQMVDDNNMAVVLDTSGRLKK